MKYIVEVTEDGTFWRNEKGELHREDGPAIELANGSKTWWLNGKLHREDGPAIEHSHGFKRWYLNGEQLSEEEFNSRLTQTSVSLDGKEVEIEGFRYVLRKP